VADGTVYVGSADDNLYAVDAATGDQRWAFETGDVVYSSPTVADGTVYVGSYDDNLYAVWIETEQQPTTSSTMTPTSSTTPTPTPTSSPDSTATTTPLPGADDDGGGSQTTTPLTVLASYVLGFAILAVAISFVLYLLYREYKTTPPQT
jgi:outer membrane protein assembly factor BamB